MKIFLVSVIIIGAIAAALGFRNNNLKIKASLISTTPKSFYDLSYTSIDGKTIQMSDYAGKYVLCVNVASKCGNTPQYDALQELYTKYQDKLVIIGFPCNQFLGQESGTEEEIAAFCKKNYGVTFPLSSKLDVKGTNQHPVYTWLTSKELNGVADDKIEWNFHKVLISPEGDWLQAFSAGMDPMNGEIEKAMNK